MVLFFCNAVLIARPIRANSTQMLPDAVLAFRCVHLVKSFRSDLAHLVSMVDSLLTFFASSGCPQTMAPRKLVLKLSPKSSFPMHVS